MPRNNSVKDFRLSIHGCSYKSFRVTNMKYGIRILDGMKITSNMVSACDLVMRKLLKDKGNFMKKIHPDKYVTKKPLKSRMGKGKGKFEHMAMYLRPGKVIYEFQLSPYHSAVESDIAKHIFKQIKVRMPSKMMLERKI